MRLGSYILLVPALLALGGGTPLDDYVNRPDSTYSYGVIDKYKGPDYTLYTVNMTSQTWMPIPNWHNQPVWWHYLSLVVPDTIVTPDAGFLYIQGGDNTDGLPPPENEFIEQITIIGVSTGTITANLRMVPNQPIVFTDDPAQVKRYEDAIIAWTWNTFVKQNGSNPEVLLRMPMTKAAVRAIDTMQDFAMKNLGNNITKFMVAGESKRGWTTWTTGAVDNRVITLAPIVMDLLNMQENLHHYFRSLGGWTFAFEDYYDVNFTTKLDDPNIKKMQAIIDPLSYTDRYATKPKLIISTGGDEFFMIDDSRFYRNRLKGPTYFRQIPNAEHGLTGHRVSLTFTLRAFYLFIMTGRKLPQMTWTKEFTADGGRITLNTDTRPSTIQVFHATTLDGTRKDFRLFRGTPGNPTKPEAHPVFWLSDSVTSLGNNTYVAEIKNPSFGWTGFFIQVTFAHTDGTVLEFTTETLIIPDTYPFPDCHAESCKGTLL